MPFQTGYQPDQARRSRSVQRLEQAPTENAVVNCEPAEHPPDLGGVVNPSFPAHPAKGVEILRVFVPQQGLGHAVTALLVEIRFHGIAPVMPDETGMRERNLPAALQDPPADIHVVTGRAEHGIKPVDLVQRPFPERHVTAGNMLGMTIVEHHVRRAARGDRHAAGDRVVFQRREVVAANRRGIVAQQVADKVIQPVTIHATIAVGERHDLAAGGVDPDIARGAQAAVWLVNSAHLGMFGGNLARVIGRAVVDQDHFVVRVVQVAQRVEARA